MKKSYWIFYFLLMCSLVSHSQRMWKGNYNRLGMQAGVNHFNIHTGNFDVTSKTSWTAGFTARANYYNDFQFIYGLNFFDFNVEIPGRQLQEDVEVSEALQYNMIAVQANFFGSYKIIGNYLSIEAGPVVQVNGKFEPREDKKRFYVQDYDIQAIDLENVSVFNVNFAAGISGGFESVKFFAQYQYGINNFFNGLKGEDLDESDPRVTDLSGNLSIITGGVMFFL
ncbi:hypothetical protein [Salinimicrobium sp. GXAS 041]|uniref:hypothetical protein n=1 Tax=Salinimicrobium sp. GXAS 041 TaxID=3400806 RepID=UPI003C75BF10